MRVENGSSNARFVQAAQNLKTDSMRTSDKLVEGIQSDVRKAQAAVSDKAHSLTKGTKADIKV